MHAPPRAVRDRAAAALLESGVTMAHIAKYKAASCGHMLAHYRRDESSLGRDNIDPKRVKNDMVVAHYTNKDGKLVVGRVVPREGEPNWGTVERRIERVNEAQKAAGKRATRKDAVVMADVVVTLPDNVRKGDEDRFFRLTYWYLSEKFGIVIVVPVIHDKEVRHGYRGHINEDSNRVERALQPSCEGDWQVEELLR